MTVDPVYPALSAETRARRKRISDPVFGHSCGVLHLGGHIGQEARYYAAANKPALWVEAMPDIFNQLEQRLSSFDNQSALCALLGNIDGKQTTFNISNNQNGVSSSVFQFGNHGQGDKSLWPRLDLAMIDKITLPMTRLDTLLSANNINPASYNYWVLDLQGAEQLALQGAPNVLQDCIAVYTEVSTVDVYLGGVLWPELKSEMSNHQLVPLWEPEIPHDDVLFVKR